MEVVSIDDYDRARDSRLDDIMQNAVDQLEAFADPKYSYAELDVNHNLALSDMTIEFGSLALQAEHNEHLFRFEFEPPTVSKKWPGPTYGSISLHKRIPKLPSPSKANRTRKASARSPSSSNMAEKKHGRHEDHFGLLSAGPRKSSTPPTKTQRKAGLSKTLAPETTYPTAFTKATSRDPPLTLMTLPPEIRNEIWSHLVLSPTPLVAQLRSIQPRPKSRSATKTVIRRFPLEPALAHVNHQLQHEVLSIFYGSNTFLFERPRFLPTKSTTDPETTVLGLTATSPGVLRMWKPRAEFAKVLRSVEIKFGLETMGLAGARGQTGTIMYSLHRVRLRRMDKDSDGVVVGIVATKGKGRVMKKAGNEMDVCLCREQAVAVRAARESEEDMARKREGRDLIEVAVGILGIGQSSLMQLPNPQSLACPACKLERGKYSPVGMSTGEVVRD